MGNRSLERHCGDWWVATDPQLTPQDALTPTELHDTYEGAQKQACVLPYARAARPSWARPRGLEGGALEGSQRHHVVHAAGPGVGGDQQ